MFAGDGKYIPPPVFMLVLLSEKCYTGACGKHFCKDEICGTEMKR